MRILVFTEGTIIMHQGTVGHSREEIVRQVKEKEKSVYDYKSYVPIGDAVKKLKNWKKDGAEIFYLTSRRKTEVGHIKTVLKKYGFPDGQLFFRRKSETYKDIVEKIMPDILIEDDCESIGGKEEMAITHVKPELRKKIKSIVVKEFDGVDHLPDTIPELMTIGKNQKTS